VACAPASFCYFAKASAKRYATPLNFAKYCTAEFYEIVKEQG
jgi:hypothetical protein